VKKLPCVLSQESGSPSVVPGATFAGRRFAPQENGEIVIPFTAQPGPQPLILHDGAGFASLETITLAGEAYELDAGFHFEREQLLAGGKATLAVRPRLLLNDQPVSVKLLDKVQLVLTSTDLDGIASTTTVANFKLDDDREATHEISCCCKTGSRRRSRFSRR
jgi:hypothetical protein